MKYIKHYSALTLLITFMLSNSAQALIYDESVDGSLSNDPSSPTSIRFDAGANTVKGSADNFLQGDGEFFSFDLLEGESLTSITLNNYIVDFTAGFDPVTSFFGIGDMANGVPVRTNNNTGLVPGDPNTSLFTASLFGELDVVAPGEAQLNLLDIANRTTVDEENTQLNPFMSGFDGTLGPGSYWVWISETADSIQYDLIFNVDSSNVVATPIPASLLLLAGPLGLLMRFKKRTIQ